LDQSGTRLKIVQRRRRRRRTGREKKRRKRRRDPRRVRLSLELSRSWHRPSRA
jgi:hypothetical protein